MAGNGGGGRTARLWAAHRPDLSRRAGAAARRAAARRQARRRAGRAADQVRARHQSPGRRGHRSRGAGRVPAARRQGDRLKMGGWRSFHQIVVVDVGMKVPPPAAGWLLIARACHAWMAVAPMHTARTKTMIATLTIRPFGTERMRALHWFLPGDESRSRREV